MDCFPGDFQEINAAARISTITRTTHVFLMVVVRYVADEIRTLQIGDVAISYYDAEAEVHDVPPCCIDDLHQVMSSMAHE